MSTDIDLSTASVSALAAAMARGEVSSVQLLQACLDRIDRFDPVLGAFTEIFADQALRDAASRDRALAAGAECGPLHGIPVAFKDLVDIAGRRTTVGSRLFDGYVAGHTATLVSRLESAGMVALGKTRMVELAFGGWGTNAIAGTPRNPWDATCHRIPGGSSSGAAVAVSAGFVPVAIGTDTGGSVRIPAALCGLVGLKTMVGKIPVDRVVPLSESLDTIGPITRSVADAALVFDALTGQSNTGVVVAGQLRTGRLDVGGTRCRIGILNEQDMADVEPDILRAYRETADQLVSLGADLVEFTIGRSFEEFAEKNGVIIGYEGWQMHGDRINASPEVMDPNVLARFRAGERVTSGEYDATLFERHHDRGKMLDRLSEIDVLLTPATPITAVEVDDVDETSLLISRFTRPINYLGLCALAVPCGLDSNGLPVSVQIVGSPGSEATLINIGTAYEQARGRFPAPDLSGFCGSARQALNDPGR
jgi:aspartyl-tRNA(Asn)/glutamyl-tRNA(Gln) amidotransferase subunit A